MNGTSSVPINFGVRAKRIKKGSYGISGTVTITDALDGYDVDKDFIICFVNYLLGQFSARLNCITAQTAATTGKWHPSNFHVGLCAIRLTMIIESS